MIFYYKNILSSEEKYKLKEKINFYSLNENKLTRYKEKIEKKKALTFNIEQKIKTIENLRIERKPPQRN